MFWSASTSVPGASNKLAESDWVSTKLGEWLIEYEIFLDGLAQQWRPQKK